MKDLLKNRKHARGSALWSWDEARYWKKDDWLTLFNILGVDVIKRS